MQVTTDEVLAAKRALIVLCELAKVAVDAARVGEPADVIRERILLFNLISKAEALAKSQAQATPVEV